MRYVADIRASWRTLPFFALMGAVLGGFAAYVPQTKALAGASDAGFAAALLAASVGALLAMAVAPRVERAAGSAALALSGALMLLAFPALAMVCDLAGLVAVMAVAGATLGLLDVAMNAQVARDEAATGRSLMNLNHGVYSLAYAVAALAVAPMRAADLGIGVFYLATAFLGAVCLWSLRRAATQEIAASSRGPQGRIPVAVLWGGVIVAVAFGAENAVESWSALHIERTLGGSVAQGAIGPAMLGLAMAVGRLGGQAVLRRGRETAALLWASLIAAGGTVLAATAASAPLAWAGFALSGIGLSVLAPLALSLIGQCADAASRTRAVARGALIGYTGFFVGPPLVGTVAELFGLRAAFMVVAAATLAVLPILAVMGRRGQRT